jgi:RNA polymerase sigma factor (sigma-70 family)
MDLQMPERPAEHDRKEPSVERLREDEAFRLFCFHRDRHDAARAATMWQRVALLNFDRVRGVVQTFKFSDGSRIAAHDVDDAVQEAYLRVVAMGQNFDGEALGQFRVAFKTCVYNACKDFGRREWRHTKRAAGSLDDQYEDSESSPYDGAIAKHSIAREELMSEAEADEKRLAEMTNLVAWGIGQVKNDNYRAVLELTVLEPMPGDEIAARLDITLDNVYQRRRRGMTQLEAILRDNHA